MKAAFLVLLTASAGWAQSPADRGEQIFTQTCSSGYCHGGRGAGGGAPRLASRGFTGDFISNTVSRGISGTSMPAFSQSLSRADLAAVIAYVGRLNGVTAAGNAAGPPAAPAKLTPEAQRGRALFSESSRIFGRCSTCHETGGLGIPVAAPIQNVPANAAALKALATPRVVTAIAAGETMPALVVANKTSGVTFYDLTSPPPVLHTVLPTDFRSTESSTWRHANVIGSYSDAELETVLGFLRAGQ